MSYYKLPWLLYQPVIAVERLAGRGPVLMVHSMQPAACSTLPMLRCSRAGLQLWTLYLLLLLLLELDLLSLGQSHLPELWATDVKDVTQLTLKFQTFS